MGRNEIKLRRKMMSAGSLQRHRNYSALLNQHEHDRKLKRVLRVFVYFLIIAISLVLLFMVIRWEKKQGIGSNNKTKTVFLLTIPDLTSPKLWCPFVTLQNPATCESQNDFTDLF